MSVMYWVKDSASDSPFLHVGIGGAVTIGGLLQLPDALGGVLPASTILRRVKAVRRIINQRRDHIEFMDDFFCGGKRPVLRMPTGVLIEASLSDLEQVGEYLDKLEELANLAGSSGEIAWW